MKSNLSFEDGTGQDGVGFCSLSVEACLDHLTLFKSIRDARKEPLSKRCFMVESQWLKTFNSFGEELSEQEPLLNALVVLILGGLR
jgi:hypothetical protein